MTIRPTSPPGQGCGYRTVGAPDQYARGAEFTALRQGPGAFVVPNPAGRGYRSSVGGPRFYAVASRTEHGGAHGTADRRDRHLPEHRRGAHRPLRWPRRYRPVMLPESSAISSGVPVATMRPPS